MWIYVAITVAIISLSGVCWYIVRTIINNPESHTARHIGDIPLENLHP